MMRSGADAALGLSNYYDFPTISMRPVYLPKMLLDREWRTQWYRGPYDPIHPNCQGARLCDPELRERRWHGRSRTSRGGGYGRRVPRRPGRSCWLLFTWLSTTEMPSQLCQMDQPEYNVRPSSASHVPTYSVEQSLSVPRVRSPTPVAI